MIRKTLDTDIPAVMAIYDAARAFMRAHGNATQWPEGTPSAEQLAADIAADGSYVCEVDGRVVATFAFLPARTSAMAQLRTVNGVATLRTPCCTAWHPTAPRMALRPRCLPLPRNVSTICVSTRTKTTCLCRVPSPRPGLSASVSYMCRTVRRASRLIGCARHKGRVTYQRFTEMKMAPSGAIFGKTRCCGARVVIAPDEPGQTKREAPAFARREPTKIAARQRGAMSLVGG